MPDERSTSVSRATRSTSNSPIAVPPATAQQPTTGDGKTSWRRPSASSPPSDADLWYVIHAGKELGPLWPTELVRKVALGEIDADDLVKHTGGLWTKARDFGFLQQRFFLKKSREEAKQPPTIVAQKDPVSVLRRFRRRLQLSPTIVAQKHPASVVVQPPANSPESDESGLGCSSKHCPPRSLDPGSASAVADASQNQKAGSLLWVLPVTVIVLFLVVVFWVSVLKPSGGTPPKESMRQNEGITASRSPLSADEVFVRASPAVVQVVIQDRQGRDIGTGSGFLVSKKGLIATNYHVIQNAYTAHLVLADNTELTVLGVAALDKESDLAIVKVAGEISAHPLEMAGNDLPPVGVKVYAIGNPRGLANTLSDGLVSGHQETPRLRITMIQTTAPISPGSSGGPLLGADGKVVGVTSLSRVDGQNLNFAVPVSHVARLLSRCNGEVKLTQLPRGANNDVSRRESVDEVSYYPLTVGNAWTYHGPGYTKIVNKVVAHEKIGNTMCARIETQVGGVTQAFEHIGITANGIYRYSYNGTKIDKPILLLKLPAKKGDEWMIDSKVGTETVTGKLTTTEDELTVQAGRYDAVVAGGTVMTGGKTLELANYFVKGIGIAKIKMDVKGQSIVIELDKFEPAK